MPKKAYKHIHTDTQREIRTHAACNNKPVRLTLTAWKIHISFYSFDFCRRRPFFLFNLCSCGCCWCWCWCAYAVSNCSDVINSKKKTDNHTAASHIETMWITIIELSVNFMQFNRFVIDCEQFFFFEIQKISAFNHTVNGDVKLPLNFEGFGVQENNMPWLRFLPQNSRAGDIISSFDSECAQMIRISQFVVNRFGINQGVRMDDLSACTSCSLLF